MIDRGKSNLLGVLVDSVDYEAAVERIIGAARERVRYACTALAVHGVITGVLDSEQRWRLNSLDLVTPDGQPVRWGVNSLHGAELPDRVYGPTLMLEVCRAAAAAGLPIYLYGAKPEVVGDLEAALTRSFPGLVVAGAEPSRFRRLSAGEQAELADRVRGSSASITFVGLGCPRQEVFAYEMADVLGMPVIAVGAAFDYHAGVMSEPSERLQRLGLQWLHRLLQDPRRLWKRYLLYNSLYVLLFAAQRLHLWRPSTRGVRPENTLAYG